MNRKSCYHKLVNNNLSSVCLIEITNKTQQTIKQFNWSKYKI